MMPPRGICFVRTESQMFPTEYPHEMPIDLSLVCSKISSLCQKFLFCCVGDASADYSRQSIEEQVALVPRKT